MTVVINSTPEDISAHRAAMLRYARLLTRDEVAADDLVQEALLRAHQRRTHIRAGRPLKPWLFAIVRNVFISGWRRRRAEGARNEQIALVVADHQPPPQEESAYLQQIARRFAALPEGQRETLHLVAVEGLSYRDAADALSVPVGTVMSRLSRARATLRQEDDTAIAHKLRVIGGREDE